jgi:hypothetical protein
MTSPELTIDDVRDRMKAAGLVIPEDRLEIVRRLLADALRPIRATDWRAASTVEPAVTFDATDEGGDDGRR